VFRRIYDILNPRGRFVLADLITPADPDDIVTPIDGVLDRPSPLTDQLAWLHEAGFSSELHWHHCDLAVLSASRRT